MNKIVDLEDKSCCGSEMKKIGEDVREVLECIPAIYFVIRYIIPKYVCPVCGGDEGCHGTVASQELPARILPGSSAGNSVIAEVVADKIADALPGYRQSKRHQRFELTISRRTVTNWLLNVGKKCHVLEKLLLEAVTDGGTIQMDETPFQVMGEEGRDNTNKSYMWVMRSTADRPVTYFKYAATRAAAVPRELLAGYKGVVQTDGYKGYAFLDKDPKITLVACWAHVRRKFNDAIKASPKRKKSKMSHAEKAVSMIGELYAVEKCIRHDQLTPDEALTLRQREAKPRLEAFKHWLDDHATKVPQSSLLGKAIHYALQLWPRLVRYADSGTIPIDNNGIENAIRPFVLGRKNWMFAGSPEGADALAILYSLVETAKSCGWEPYAYLRFLFDHLPNAIGDEERRRLLPNIAQPVPTSFFVGNDSKFFQDTLALETTSV